MKLVIGDGKSIDADEIVTGRTCIIGQSGSGKSYTVAVLCEELAKNNIGFCIIDLEGEYFSLKEKYPILWVGSDSNADVDIENVDFKALAKKIIEKGFPTIFDVSEVDNPQESVKLLLREIYRTETTSKKPFLVIVEEIDKFAPQKGKTLYEIEEISRRGRKRGIGLLVATQRPALVNKNILSQCANQIIGKLTINNDIDSVKIFFPNKKQLEKLPMLQPGYFFVQGAINAQGEVMKIRQRETQHKAITPKLIQKAAIETDDLKTIEIEIEKNQESEQELEEIKKEYVPVKVSQEQAFESIKSKTGKFLFFGQDANISNLHLKLFPMYEIQLRYLKKGLIKKGFEDFYVYLDAVEGNIVSLDKGVKILFETGQIVGLNENEINALKLLLKKELSATEISFKTGYSESSLRKIIKFLSEKKLIKTKKIGRNILYSGFTSLKMPGIRDFRKKKAELSNEPVTAELVKPRIDAKNIKTLMKGIEENAEIIEKKMIYYPYYEAIIIKGKSKSKIVLDAVTKRIVS